MGDLFTVDGMMQFLQDRWFIIAAVIIALFIVIKIVKTAIKWAIVVALIAGLVFYGSAYTDELMVFGDKIKETAMNQLEDIVAKEAKNATYQVEEDGSFTAESPSLKLTGKPDSDKVTVYLKGQRLGTFSMSDLYQTFIDTALANSQQ